MKTTRTTARTTARTATKAAAQVAHDTDVTVVDEATEAKTDIKASVKEVIEQAKSRSKENRLAVLGLIANARRASDERKAELIEAGRAYEPELQARIDELKTKFKMPEGKGFKFELPSLGKKADKADKADKAEPNKLQTVLNTRLAESFSRMGLPTRKDFDELSRKVDKLIELQRA
jgi:Poly(hydroxyalcanoate) granule associated protein (phasin)